MKIKLFVVGNKIEKYIIEGIKEYEKRLSRYCKINLQFFKNEEQLQKKISPSSYKLNLTINDTLLSSEDLSDKINTFGVLGNSDITILVNAPQTEADEYITLSKMDMDVGIKTLVLIEQIYRAYRILHNEPYHK